MTVVGNFEWVHTLWTTYGTHCTDRGVWSPEESRPPLPASPPSPPQPPWPWRSWSSPCTAHFPLLFVVVGPRDQTTRAGRAHPRPRPFLVPRFRLRLSRSCCVDHRRVAKQSCVGWDGPLGVRAPGSNRCFVQPVLSSSCQRRALASHTGSQHCYRMTRAQGSRAPFQEIEAALGSLGLITLRGRGGRRNSGAFSPPF